MIKFLNLSENIIDEIYNIEVNSFSHPWSKNEFINEISNNVAKYFCLSVNDKIVGYIGVWQICDEGHITNVAVAPQFRKSGYGEILVRKLIEYAKINKFLFLTLEVRISNENAINLYKKCGFCQVGIRKKYYENTEDALLMTLEISI